MAWRDYQVRRASPAEVRRWARRGLFGNVGIVCGQVSGNLVVLDFDAPDAYDAFHTRFPSLENTFMVATGGGGWHVYLRVGDLPLSRRGQGVELCAEGRQVVAPPSVHPTTGQGYRVHLPRDIRRVPDLSEVAEWLENTRTSMSVHQPFAGREPVTHWTTSPTLVAAIADTLRARGYWRKSDWLNGPCIYPQRHAHADHKTSFGFNIRSGYGNCFVCGSMLAKDVVRTIGIDPIP